MHPNHLPYFRFTGKGRFDKTLNSLLGIIEGITIDGVLNASEIGFLQSWVIENQEFADRHPFNELVPQVEAALADGTLTSEEVADIRWLCDKLRSTEYSSMVTADVQRLHALIGSLMADGVVTEDELRGLSGWLQDHGHLRQCWPYDEVDAVVTGVMADRRIDENEQAFLKAVFAEFVSVLDDRTITRPVIIEGATLVGLCAVCPEIAFEGSTFCFTGASFRYSRSALAETVQRLGGLFAEGVSKKVDYLIIGAEGNPCWSYACYGRKVEKAVQLRKLGANLLLVHENDFHDAVQDRG